MKSQLHYELDYTDLPLNQGLKVRADILSPSSLSF